MQKFLDWFDKAAVNFERFFNSLTFLPRFLNAAGKATTAFNDEFFKDDKSRKKLIEERRKKELEVSAPVNES
ncbi:MAG: hypothetical protein JWO32_2972 [Bacteroidetes bacterium]|nr:hypothetical protein [Bacteroidota bacterium]